ncbi:ribonuclease Z [Brevibacillus laterosporus]|uniref:ribonuclease Z n=1 Tax=Brevibacillus laterosporus TaxID=1465 RepID=UPI000EB23826|nr:ribonuclease Z [Brevibacillus laterosporus]AYK07397.1 ribonuclease Z [Brevibacillus laterosporus]MDF9412669.1 ribonuclease Z [Brevibacillus laterosporus]
MQIVFLGTSSGAPTTKRNVSGIGLRLMDRGAWWLIDCGEGTQHQIMRSVLNISQLEKIFITHLHGDHLYGLIGMLASRSLRGAETGGITLYGPKGIDEYVQAIMRISPVHLQYPLIIKVVEEGIIYEDDTIVVEAAKVKHRVPAFAYSMTEKPRPGSFKIELAKEAGIPKGPMYAQLKAGGTVQLEDGRVFHGKDFVHPPQPGLKVAFSGDTIPCQNMVRLAQGADMLVHESTYVHQHLELAERSGHSTAKQAAEIAVAAEAKGLLLTHLSPRYDIEDGPITLDDMLQEAQEVFLNTQIAQDLCVYEVKRTRLL